MLPNIFESMRNKNWKTALSTGLNNASALSTIGLVIVILRKKANSLHTEINTSRQIIFPMRRQRINCTNWNKAIAMWFNIAGEPLIRRLRMPVKCGFNIRDNSFVNTRPVEACDKRIGRIVSQRAERPCTEPGIYIYEHWVVFFL